MVKYGCDGNYATAFSTGTKWCGNGAFGTASIPDAQCFCEDGDAQPDAIPGCDGEKPSLGWTKCGVAGVTCDCNVYGRNFPSDTGRQIRFGCNDVSAITDLPSWNSRFCSDNANLNPDDTYFSADVVQECACGCDAEWTYELGCCRFGGENNIEPLATEVFERRGQCQKACEDREDCVTFEWRSTDMRCELFGTSSDSTARDTANCLHSRCYNLQCINQEQVPNDD
jgi:hypothetical protein